MQLHVRYLREEYRHTPVIYSTLLLIVNSSTKYYVAYQERKGIPLLHLRGNTEHFHIAVSYIYAKNLGTYCCVVMETMVTRMRHNVVSYYVVCRVGMQKRHRRMTWLT